MAFAPPYLSHESRKPSRLQDDEDKIAQTHGEDKREEALDFAEKIIHANYLSV